MSRNPSLERAIHARLKELISEWRHNRTARGATHEELALVAYFEGFRDAGRALLAASERMGTSFTVHPLAVSVTREFGEVAIRRADEEESAMRELLREEVTDEQIEEVTDEQIELLRAEALIHYDPPMAALCSAALDGDIIARRVCGHVIRGARAEEDTNG